jgi:hypothetical protein
MGHKRKAKDKKHKNNVSRHPQHNDPIDTQSQQYSMSWRASKALSWTYNTLVGAGVYIGLSRIPGALASALPDLGNLNLKRTDHTASDLMRQATQISCDNGTQIDTWFPVSTVTATPIFRMVNGAMVTASIGPYTGSAYYRFIVNSFNQNNNPLLPANIPVDAGTWDAGNPFVIATESGPVFCYNTVTSTDQTYCVPYTDNLQPAGSIQNVAYWNSYSQRNPRGAPRKGGGFEVLWEDDYFGNPIYNGIFWKGFQSDNVTPINPQEVRVSTIANSNNINGQIIVNPDNSGTHFWQQKINNNYCIVKRSYNIARNFTDVAEVNLSNATLPNYDAVNVQPAQFSNGQGKLVYLASPTPGGKYNFYVQNITLYPNFQLVGKPVNITANQGITFNLNTAYSVMVTENNGLRISIAAPDTSLSYQALIMNVNPDNTLNGNITPIDPNSYSQTGSTIVDRGNGRFTVGYQGGTNVVFQTYSANPFMNTPNNVTINELANNQTVSLPGFFVEQTTYQQNQITATITVAPNIMALSTTASLPANAAVNYDTNTGTLTLTTSGSSCKTDMNNLLCKLQGYVQAYGRISGNMDITITDDSGQMYNTSIPVDVVTQNFIPTVRNAYLYIGQNNRSQLIFDIQTQDNVPANSLNVFLGNLNPSAATAELVNGTVTEQGITQYTLNENNQVWVQQLGGNNAPQFTVAVSSYDGQPSVPVNVNVFFFPTPQEIARQFTYYAKNTTDTTPIPITNINFEVINSNSPTTEQIWLVYYGSNPHGGIYRKGDFNNPITSFSQADADNVTNPVLFFIPDGSGQDPNFSVGFTDGYNTLPVLPVNIQYTVAPAPVPAPSTPQTQANNSNFLNTTSLALKIAGAFIGLVTAEKRYEDFIRHYINPFANFVKRTGWFYGQGFGYFSFESNSGAKFSDLIDKLETLVIVKRKKKNIETGIEEGEDIAVPIKGIINDELKNYNFFIRFIPFYTTKENETLKRIAAIFASELKDYKDVDEHFSIRLLCYLAFGGLPLKKDMLNLAENEANIRKIADNITQKLAEDTSKKTCCNVWSLCNGKSRNNMNRSSPRLEELIDMSRSQTLTK